MGDNNINISGLDFTKLPDDWKIKVNLDNVSGSTMNALNKIDGVDISDDINKNEAELIIMAINTDENASEIDMDEINKFCSENNIAKSGGIEGIISNIVTNSREKLEPQQDNFSQEDNIDSTQAANEDDNTTDETKANNQDDSSSIKINIQKWGSTADDGNKYANDCLSHIIANNYPDLKPYSQEWFDKELEIMNANPEIYGTVDENGNVSGARHSVSGTDRHNATLYESDELVLPGIKVVKYVETSAALTEASEEKDIKGQDPTGEATGEKVTDNNGYSIETITDENGNTTGRKQYDSQDNVIWESSITTGENNTVIETKNWTESGEIQEIIYDNNGNEISMTTTYADNSTAQVNYKYENNTKSAEVIFNDENGKQIANSSWNFNEDGTITETKSYIDNPNIKESNIYDQYQNILNKTITKNNAETITTTVTEYTNRMPSSTAEYTGEEAIEENKISTTEYSYESDSYTTTTTYINPQSDNDPISHSVTLNNDGKTLNAQTAFKNGTTSQTQYSYEEDGSCIETINFAYPEGITLEGSNYKTLQTKYDSSGNKTIESYVLIGNEATGEITGTNTFEGGKETRTQLEANTGKYTIKTIECNTTTLEVLQNDTKTITTSNGDIKTGETVIKYDPGTENVVSKTETEYYSDGITPKIVTITNAQGTNITGHYDENGTLVNIEGEGEKTLLSNYDTLKETASVGETLKLTELSTADQNELEANGSITKGEYIIQKMNDGSLRTSKSIKIEENGIIKDVQMIIKEEYPGGEIKLYENNNGERRIKEYLDENGNISTYSYSNDYQPFIFDKKTYTFKISDTNQTRQIVETKDPNGNILSKTEYAYDGQENQVEIAKYMYENGQLIDKIETAKINTYTETIKADFLGESSRYNAIITMLEDEDLSCGDLTEILNKFNSEDRISNFMDCLPKNDTKEQNFFDKLAAVIEKSAPNEIGNFLKAWQEHTDGNSLMNSIQERQSFGTETVTLKNIAKVLNKKINDMNINYSSDNILAAAQKNGLRKNAYDISKIYNLKTSGEIDDKTTLSLIMYICDGDLQNIINALRGGGNGWFNSISSGFQDKQQEDYVKFIEDLLISNTNTQIN